MRPQLCVENWMEAMFFAPVCEKTIDVNLGNFDILVLWTLRICLGKFVIENVIIMSSYLICACEWVCCIIMSSVQIMFYSLWLSYSHSCVFLLIILHSCVLGYMHSGRKMVYTRAHRLVAIFYGSSWKWTSWKCTWWSWCRGNRGWWCFRPGGLHRWEAECYLTYFSPVPLHFKCWHFDYNSWFWHLGMWMWMTLCMCVVLHVCD